MRIALVHPSFGAWGGAESMLLWIARGLRERGHHVVMHAGAFSERARLLFGEAGVPLCELRHMHGRPWTRLQLGFTGGWPRLGLRRSRFCVGSRRFCLCRLLLRFALALRRRCACLPARGTSF